MAMNDQDKQNNSVDNEQQSNGSGTSADKTVFRKPAQINEDKTVFAPKLTPSQSELSDRTVIADALQNTSRPNQPHTPNDATVFSPRTPHLTANDNAMGVETGVTEIAVEQNSELKLLKNRFVLEEIIGVGGMGVVYKAKDLLRVEAQDKDPYVAIKVLSEEFKTHPEAFISLQRESKKAQHIANQNTVKVYDFDRDGDIVFMTMEFMVGQPLDELVKQYHATGLPRLEARNILEGMCLALIHAHSEQIVHSDLKPGNIFVTDSGVAKIFDFGIARAVAKIDRTNNEQDRTVFDAGNLGALTPAYASREMLLGQIPDVRDDIYALGCIAYEILTGDHPFTRLPADEAYNKKLKPKRIQGIKKGHWKAIESALAFERKDRIASVEAFYKLITEKKKSNVALWGAGLLSIAVVGFGYHEMTKEVKPQISQSELMNQLEFKVRYELIQENIARYLESPTFTAVWQASLWKEMETAEKLFPEQPTDWFYATQNTISLLYVDKIKEAISSFDHSSAKELIVNAAHYTADMTQLDQFSDALANQIAEQKQKQAQNAQADKDLIARNKASEAQRLKRLAAADKKQEQINRFNIAMGNVEQQLTCKERINMRDFKIAIEKLRDVDMTRYQQSEKKIVSELATCINYTGTINPDYARDAKRYALLLFDNNVTINKVVIKDRDHCQMSIAGLGAKGSRAICKDGLKVGGDGPTMVVIPSGNKIKAFAMGKYEISIAEYNHYCIESKACNANSKTQHSLPVTNISISNIKKYIKWLSKQTGKKYRLPTQSEWVYAANAKSHALDPNRNCQLSSRGIVKGEELLKITTGKQNRWGVVNYAGNAQELVFGKGNQLIAVGGSYQTKMDKCTISTSISHSGKADSQTGFRLARSIEGS